MPLNNLGERISQLPVLPSLLHNLMNSLGDNGASLNDISKMVASDQGIGAKVLKMANSAAYRGAKDITSIEEASKRLGTGILHSIIVVSFLVNSFPKISEEDRKDFWRHTYSVAILSRDLAKLSKIDPSTAFTCGMLYDLGNLVMLILSDEKETMIIKELIKRGVSKAQAQKRVLKMGYCQVGLLLGSIWRFPPLFIRCIAHHSAPLKQDNISNEACLLALAIEIKNLIDEQEPEIKKQLSQEKQQDLVTEILKESVSLALLEQLGMEFDACCKQIAKTMLTLQGEIDSQLNS